MSIVSNLIQWPFIGHYKYQNQGPAITELFFTGALGVLRPSLYLIALTDTDSERILMLKGPHVYVYQKGPRCKVPRSHKVTKSSATKTLTIVNHGLIKHGVIRISYHIEFIEVFYLICRMTQ